MNTINTADDIESMRQNLIKALGTNDFMQILRPIPIYATSPVYKNNVRDLITILMKDRDRDGKFTINDVVLMGGDIVAMTTFVSSMVLILSSIDKIKYSPDETERMLFKLCVYVLLISLPAECGRVLTGDEKLALLDVCVVIYQHLVATGIAKKMIADAYIAVKKSFIQCCCAPNEDQLPVMKSDFAFAMSAARKNNEINARLINIEKRL